MEYNLKKSATKMELITKVLETRRELEQPVNLMISTLENERLDSGNEFPAVCFDEPIRTFLLLLRVH